MSETLKEFIDTLLIALIGVLLGVSVYVLL